MPLNPSSYSKIFKSRYVEDEDENQNCVCDDEDLEVPTSYSSYTPTTPSYSTPKVQELLTKPKPNFDKIFSSRYLEDHSSYGRSSSSLPKTLPTTLPKTLPTSSSVSTSSILPSKVQPPTKDYDKIFTSKYLSDDYKPSPVTKRGVNPYLDNLDDVDDENDDEIVIKHRPPSRASSISRRSISTPKYNQSYNESYPNRFDFKSSSNYETKPLRSVISRSVTPRLSEPIPDSDSSLVLDANLTFILGCKSKLKENVKAIPAFKENDTESNALSSKIADFLNRTDHVMQEWQNVGSNNRKRKNDSTLSGKSKSATNIMIKGFQLYSKANSVDRSSRCGGSENDNTQCEIDEVQ